MPTIFVIFHSRRFRSPCCAPSINRRFIGSFTVEFPTRPPAPAQPNNGESIGFAVPGTRRRLIFDPLLAPCFTTRNRVNGSGGEATRIFGRIRLSAVGRDRGVESAKGFAGLPPADQRKHKGTTRTSVLTYDKFTSIVLDGSGY